MMKTQIRFYDFKKLMLMMLVLVVVTSCFTDDDGEITNDELPELVIKVTDCPVDNIGINPVVKVIGGPGRWFVEITATITCMGEPVDKAELKVKWGWIERAIKIETDSTGKAKARQRVTSTARPSGKVTVTIEGADGTKPQTVDF